MHQLFMSLYSSRPDADSQFAALIRTIAVAYKERTLAMKQLDQQKLKQPEPWFISHELMGMSLYVDRFAEIVGETGDAGYVDGAC